MPAANLGAYHRRWKDKGVDKGHVTKVEAGLKYDYDGIAATAGLTLTLQYQ